MGLCIVFEEEIGDFKVSVVGGNDKVWVVCVGGVVEWVEVGGIGGGGRGVGGEEVFDVFD